ncbi:MAG: polysaccharide biosynthesis/export family protein [bacterium]
MLALCVPFALFAQQQAATERTSPAAFSLEPGDVLQVEVWREKDLSCKCVIDEVGRLTLPMLGVLKVTAVAWPDLRDSLLSLYQRQLRNPSVTLTPLRRVWVLGEVNKPGPQLADPTLSLAGVIALAGGATTNGDLHRVRVVRDGKAIIESASVESLLLQPAIRSNDQIFVDRRPWIERNGAFVASAMIGVASVLVALIRR